MRQRLFTLSLLAFWGLSQWGCNGATDEITGLKRQATDLRRVNRSLVITTEEQARKISELIEKVRFLRALGEDRLHKLYRAAKVEIADLSSGVDSDGKLGDDGLVLYVNLFDQDGHKFKAAGDIDIHIYDLSDPAFPQIVAALAFDVDQAKAHWHGRLLTYHYRFECPWGHRRPSGRSVMAKVGFRDYLTGTTLEHTKTIDIVPTPADPSDE